MIKGLVSTVIPVYNRPNLLREAVASVLDQSYQHVELIVVDDGSDDLDMVASLECCKTMGEGKLRVYQQNNRGPGVARQYGFEQTQGEFIQFLDSDDLLYLDKFEMQVELFKLRPDADVVYGKTRNPGVEGGMTRPWKKTGTDLALLFPAVLSGRVWDTSTPLYRREIVEQVGGWSDLINEEDWEFDCRVAAQGVKLAWVDEWVSEQRSCADNRASAFGSSDPTKLKDRARARHLILESALRANVAPSEPDFQSFIRYSFLLARQCAIAGLSQEAEGLVQHLNEVAPRRLMSLYLRAGKWIGFPRTTRIAESVYRLIR